MNKITLLRNFIGVIFIVFIAYTLQTAIFSHFSLAGIVPNIMLIITGMAGFMMGMIPGMVTGTLSGILLDMSMGEYFGMYALIYLYIGVLNGLFASIFFGDDIKLPIFLIGISDLVYGFLIYFIMFFLRNRTNVSFYFLNVMMPEMVYTIIVSVIMYYPMKKICEWSITEISTRRTITSD